MRPHRLRRSILELMHRRHDGSIPQRRRPLISSVWSPLLLVAVGCIWSISAIAADSVVVDVPGRPLGGECESPAQSPADARHPLVDDPAVGSHRSPGLCRRPAEAARPALSLRGLHQSRIAGAGSPWTRGCQVAAGRGDTPVLVKVINEGAVASELKISSLQAGAVYAGTALPILARQAQTELADQPNIDSRRNRFLPTLSIHSRPPMTGRLSGLGVEYLIVLIASSEAGQRGDDRFRCRTGSAILSFGRRRRSCSKSPRRFPCEFPPATRPAGPRLCGSWFVIIAGMFIPQPKRVAPDFFFQPQIYRRDGEPVLLPPGQFEVEASRGPEYVIERTSQRRETGGTTWTFQLRRWIDPAAFGFFSGDHHIHGAGCSHYTSPTEGSHARRHVPAGQGRGAERRLRPDVGAVLRLPADVTSPPEADLVSEPFTILKYDLEISGFGSRAGARLPAEPRDQTYPGSDGTTKSWPTWTVPVLRWAKAQGGVVGYPHSAIAARLAASRRPNGCWPARSRWQTPSRI